MRVRVLRIVEIRRLVTCSSVLLKAAVCQLLVHPLSLMITLLKDQHLALKKSSIATSYLENTAPLIINQGIIFKSNEIYNINTIHSHRPAAVTGSLEIIQRESCLYDVLGLQKHQFVIHNLL